MYQAFPDADYYGNSASMWNKGNSPILVQDHFPNMPFPRSYTGLKAYRWGCRSQSFTLLFCKSMSMQWSGCILPMAPVEWPTYTFYIRMLQLTCLSAPSTFRLLNRVGEGDISALRCGLTGSYSSTFQYSASETIST